jgi:2-polyprenyl-3-methyl-5-hydroxy-6-metoxy-1,4-benzoquinol methylase
MPYQTKQKEKISEIQVNCAVCDSDRYTPLFHIPPRKIVACFECGHEYVNPIPNPSDIPECRFSPDEEISIGTQIDIAYFRKVFDKYGIKDGKLLDLGCGQGRLEKGLIGLGWQAENIYLMDSSERNVAVAEAKYHSSTAICRDAQEGIGFNNYLDCVLMVEFLEHLANPKKAFQNALAALKHEGLMILRGLPNNDSLEAFIGNERWRMRQFIHHYHFFNHETLAAFVGNFGDAQILESDTFLQEGYRFYDIARIARNIGIVKESDVDEHTTYDGTVVETADLTNLVLAKIGCIDFGSYKHKDRLPKKQLNVHSSKEDVEEFFNKVSLDQFLSPDISVVIRKVRG